MSLEKYFLPVAKAFFETEDLSQFKLVPLAGDASTRRYVRVFHGDKTYLLCLNDPQNPKHNQEFIYWTSQYSKQNIKVPEVFFYEPGYVLQEDFGDESLLVACSKEVKNLEEYYFKSLDELLKIHNLPRDNSKDYESFNSEKLNFEINMTLEFFVEKMNKEEKTKTKEIFDFFQPIVKQITGQPYVISHRDYHSKNIMVKDSGICVIDYQDSMLGARQYDLCSLVDDRYTELEESFKKTLIDYYFSKSNLDCSKEEFYKNYYYSMIQRTFKAIGSFAYHYIENGNPSYLPYINSSMESLRKVLSQFPELGNLKNSLYSYKYED